MKKGTISVNALVFTIRFNSDLMGEGFPLSRFHVYHMVPFITDTGIKKQRQKQQQNNKQHRPCQQQPQANKGDENGEAAEALYRNDVAKVLRRLAPTKPEPSILEDSVLTGGATSRSAWLSLRRGIAKRARTSSRSGFARPPWPHPGPFARSNLKQGPHQSDSDRGGRRLKIGSPSMKGQRV